MKVLVIGSGGREHALVWKIRQSSLVTDVFCAPGNPGIEALAFCPSLQVSDIDGLLRFVEKEKIDLTVVGPEQPLADGIVDVFRANEHLIFGPTKNGAELEWSKAFAKDFMRRHGIPTAAYRIFVKSDLSEARNFVENSTYPIVLKADGLAAGKGVAICRTKEEAIPILNGMMAGELFGSAGSTLIVEEFMQGEEASVFAICDGEKYLLLATAQDHKRAYDGDRGKNTGGMGSYAPATVVTDEIMADIENNIIGPTLRGMASEGRPYVGCLYVGLMITASGPKVVEYNCRFGDPETQVILPLFDGDLATLLASAARGQLSHTGRALPAGSAVCVVLASGGYPDEYQKGKEILGLEKTRESEDTIVFHAGTARHGGILVTNGGRVLGVTAIDSRGRIQKAIASAYETVKLISFSKMHYRTDIGRKALLN